MAYPLENIEIVNLCSRIRKGDQKYPDMYYDLRKEYRATKDNKGLRYSYKYAHSEDRNGQQIKAVQTVGRRDYGDVIEHKENHTLFVIHFSTR